VLLTPPLFNPNFGGVPVAPDRRCWASASTWTLSYSAVKLFSKNSNLFEHGTRSSQTDGQTYRRTDKQTTFVSFVTIYRKRCDRDMLQRCISIPGCIPGAAAPGRHNHPDLQTSPLPTLSCSQRTCRHQSLKKSI